MGIVKGGKEDIDDIDDIEFGFIASSSACGLVRLFRDFSHSFLSISLGAISENVRLWAWVTQNSQPSFTAASLWSLKWGALDGRILIWQPSRGMTPRGLLSVGSLK